MKGIWRAPRGLTKALAVLGLLSLGFLAIATAGPSGAAVRLLVPEFSAVVPVALTRDAGQDDNAPAGRQSRLAVREMTVSRGDTLAAMLAVAAIDRRDVEAAMTTLRKRFDPRKLSIGRKLFVIVETGYRGADRLAALSLELDKNSYLIIERRGGRRFVFRYMARPLLLDTGGDGMASAGERTLRLRAGDTLTGMLVRSGAERDDADKAASAIGRLVNLRRLQIGQQVIISFAPAARGRSILAAVSLKVARDAYVTALRDGRGAYAARRAASPAAPDPVATTTPAAAAVETPPPAEPETDIEDDDTRQIYRIGKGDTLSGALLRLGVVGKLANAVVDALGSRVNLRKLQVGQELILVFDPGTMTRNGGLAAVSLKLKAGKYAVAGRDEAGGFAARIADAPLLPTFPFDDADFAEASLAALPSQLNASAEPPMIELAPIPETAVRKRIDVRAGDTLMKALLKAGSDAREAEAAIAVLKTLFDPRKLRAGQRINVAFTPAADGGKTVLHHLAIGISPGLDVEAGRVEDGGFAARTVETPLERLMVHAGGTIESSLYKAATEAGVPAPVLWELIRAFSYDVDFQREIQRGDGFEVLFERYLDETGAPVREGNIIYAALTLSGAPLRIYRHTGRDGLADYYSEDGNSVRKALLRTPIDGARLTSGYGKRKDPILGYTKIHRGVDFGARRGTPFMAAGDGVVVTAGWNGAYGKYVRIRHRGQYSTAYAHLNRIASGIAPGRRVKQGQVIGYVGSTGRSTGPHLHYEVLLDGKQINPLKVKLPTGAKLKAAALAAFQRSRVEIEAQLAALPLVSRVADAMLPQAGPVNP